MMEKRNKRGRPKKCVSETKPAETEEKPVERAGKPVEMAGDDTDSAKITSNESCSGNAVAKKGHRKVAIPGCPEDREYCPSCQAYRDGKCAALWDVTFKDNVCPFYKENEQARKERIASMEKLEDTGREDLIKKYYRGKFDRVLGNELVGISYSFDDDHAVYVDEEEIPEDNSEATESSEIPSSCLSEEAVI